METVRTGAQPLEGFRLSPQQERLWRASGGQDGQAWHARAEVEIAGPLDREALGRALAAVVARHEILRTSFPLLPGLSRPLQVITDRSTPLLEICDRERLAAAVDPPFDLSKPPLLRASLAAISPDLHLLVLSLPVLLSDAAGLENLAREIAAAYGAEKVGAEPGEEPVQYVDLSEWQHEMLVSEETEEGRAYWRGLRAAEAPARPRLPFETEGEAFDPRTVRVPLAPGLRADRELLLAAWLILLRRLTGTADLSLAVISEGRKFDELATALGPFARPLPLRVRIEEETRFGDLVRILRDALAEHDQWQEYFTDHEAPGGAPSFSFEQRRRPACHSAAEVTFHVRERQARIDRFTAGLVATLGDELRLKIEYDASRLPAGEAERLAERLATLLADAFAQLDAAAGELVLIGEVERRLLVTAWNDTRMDFETERLVHRLIEEQAARTPQAAAAEWESGRLSYAELEAHANRLARRLQRLGVGPETLVGVCCERSSELVVSLLAVWKAGGAYVPLDPAHPSERLALLLRDARPAVLIVGPGAPAGLPGDVPRVDLAAEDGSLETESPAPVLSGASPGHLAYVIYTSGSTGRPKGVMVSHGAIANRLLWMQRELPLAEGDAVLQKTPFVFDASIWELFVPLLAGARLVLAKPGGHQDVAYMARMILDRRVTVLQLVPSMLGPFLDEEGTEKLGLRRLFCGGEALPAALRDRAFARLAAEVCNLYGPTECAIDATFHLCSPGEAGGATVPIGRPLANVQVYLLDRCQLLAPLGTPGELCVGGDGLARGYLGRPDLTADRFIPDPFSPEAGRRLYRTGDLARWLPSGELEFLGRIDQQVKVRGFRIEPGEIESCLAAHPAVTEAVVAARADVSGDWRLTAYVVLRAGQSPSDMELRDWLSARLPEPMIPSSWTRLPTLPRLPSGKVDRASLPTPSSARTAESEGFSTPIEELLAARWAEVLGVERLGPHDNVFTLGWHSLMATRLISRLRRTFGVELPMRSLFENPTVASLAWRIDEALRGDGALVAPPIVPVPRDRAMPLSFAQRRLWFLDQLQPGSPFYNIPLALRFAGRLDIQALARSLAEIARRHEALRTRFAQMDDEPVQVIDPPAPVALPEVDLSSLPETERSGELRRLIAEESLRPFDLTRGPLLRATLVRLGADEHAGLLTLHHIVSDGWSTAVLVRELRALYAAFAEDQPSPLPPLPLQYADYASWQSEWMRGRVLEAHVGWWRRQLDGAPPLLYLPADRPRPEIQSFRGATCGRLLPADLALGFRDLARRESVTLFMAALTAGAVLLGWRAGQEDLVIGTDVAGRDRGETEGIIGFFINQLPLRVRLAGDPSFRELLARVRQTTLEAYAHQDMPFDRLVEILNPERSGGFSPIFQVKINLHDDPPPALDLPGITIEPLAVARATAQFDWILNLRVSERGLLAAVEYSTDLFDDTTVCRMLGNFEALLRAVTRDPELRLNELSEVLEESDAEQRIAAQDVRRQSLHDKLRRSRRSVAAGEVAR